jgi:hypothetical protein
VCTTTFHRDHDIPFHTEGKSKRESTFWRGKLKTYSLKCRVKLQKLSAAERNSRRADSMLCIASRCEREEEHSLHCLALSLSMHRRTFVAIHVERKMQLLAMSEPKLIKRGREH